MFINLTNNSQSKKSSSRFTCTCRFVHVHMYMLYIIYLFNWNGIIVHTKPIIFMHIHVTNVMRQTPVSAYSYKVQMKSSKSCTCTVRMRIMFQDMKKIVDFYILFLSWKPLTKYSCTIIMTKQYLLLFATHQFLISSYYTMWTCMYCSI